MLDDEIATAGSIVALIDKIWEYGVNSVGSPAPGLFTGKAPERLNACEAISEIVTTNTVPQTDAVDKLTVLSVAPLFAEAIKRIHSGESVSRLFSDEDTYGA